MVAFKPMTVSALELTRHAYATADGGDFDAMMRFYGSESVWDVSRWGLGTHVGPLRIRRFLEDWIGSFEAYEMEVHQMREVGLGVVYVDATQKARPTGSRARLELRSASVFVWEDDVALAVTHYRDFGEARAAAEQAVER